jgi:hypothetical protein
MEMLLDLLLISSAHFRSSLSAALERRILDNLRIIYTWADVLQ